MTEHDRKLCILGMSYWMDITSYRNVQGQTLLQVKEIKEERHQNHFTVQEFIKSYHSTPPQPPPQIADC